MPKCRASKIEKILLVAGGTGGHIWPAIAFGSWILENRSGVTIKYLSGKRALESEIYRSCDIEPLKIDMEGSPFSAPKGTRIRRWVDLLSLALSGGEGDAHRGAPLVPGVVQHRAQHGSLAHGLEGRSGGVNAHDRDVLRGIARVVADRKSVV